MNDDRPYTVLSSAMSLDGHLDSASPPRLLLSNALDLDRVDALRAASDAILVGARTVRLDDPRLLVRSAMRRDHRRLEGLSATPWKVTMTRSGDLSPDATFFRAGTPDASDDPIRLVYCPRPAARRLGRRLGSRAVVVGLTPARADGAPTVGQVARDLADRGIARLMVEGGESVHTQFLTAGLVDELHLAVAPFFVGDPAAPRFVGGGAFPWDPAHRARLLGVEQLGDVVVLRYALSDRAANERTTTRALAARA